VDWYRQAQNNWSIYHDPARIAQYVQFGKITQAQYEEIISS
jgi:hypothetical protein